MFGYVLVNKPELKIKEFEKYRSYYCGLCHALADRHGQTGRMTLNYDMTFLIMLLSDLYDQEETLEESRCIVHHTISVRMTGTTKRKFRPERAWQR